MRRPSSVSLRMPLACQPNFSLPVREGDAADALREERRLRGSGLGGAPVAGRVERSAAAAMLGPPTPPGSTRKSASAAAAAVASPTPSWSRRRGARAGRRSAAMRARSEAGASTAAPTLRTRASARSCSASSAARSGERRERRFDLCPPPAVERSVRKRSELDRRVVGWVGASPVPQQEHLDANDAGAADFIPGTRNKFFARAREYRRPRGVLVPDSSYRLMRRHETCVGTSTS